MYLIPHSRSKESRVLVSALLPWAKPPSQKYRYALLIHHIRLLTTTFSSPSHSSQTTSTPRSTRFVYFSRILASFPGSCKFAFTRLNSKIISPACRSSTKPRSIVTALAGNLMLVVSPYGRRRCPLGMVGCTTLRVPRASFSALLASRCVTVTHLVVVYILRSYRNQLCRSSSPGRLSRRRAFC